MAPETPQKIGLSQDYNGYDDEWSDDECLERA